jgi:hypothetical protein
VLIWSAVIVCATSWAIGALAGRGLIVSHLRATDRMHRQVERLTSRSAALEQQLSSVATAVEERVGVIGLDLRSVERRLASRIEDNHRLLGRRLDLVESNTSRGKPTITRPARPFERPRDVSVLGTGRCGIGATGDFEAARCELAVRHNAGAEPSPPSDNY